MFRPANADDLDFLVHGQREMAKETEGLTLDESVLRAGVSAILDRSQPGEYFIFEASERRIAQLLITYEWSDWRNRVVWWIQSVWVEPDARGQGCFRRLYEAVRERAERAGAGGLRLYVDERNVRAQEVYRALGMDGAHYRVFEDMF